MVETIDQQPLAADGSANPRRAALRNQLTLLTLAAVASGFLWGHAQARGSAGLIVVAVGLLLTTAIAVLVAHLWIALPIIRLAVQLDGLALGQRQTQVRALPTDRDDEVGQMADAVRRIMVYRIRDHHDARQLRRTLDDRVRRATRSAVLSMQKLAMRDAMTDLGNRRFLETQLPQLIDASLASQTDLVCLMIDLDNFKQANDTLGHHTGDELIKLLADLLKSACREEDLAIRFGGDEFAVFMPGADLDRAEEFTRHVRQHFRQQSAVLLRNQVKTDVSIGAASMLKEHCRDGQALMDQADRYLYRAKRAGKGLTCSLRGMAAA